VKEDVAMDNISGRRGGRLAAAALAISFLIPVGAYAQAIPGPAPGTTQVPQPAQGGVNWPGAGYGAAALVSNIFYIPAKLVYAVAGGLVGGGSYLVTGGNSQVSNTIWRSSLGGDYVVTPDMIAGKEPLYFSGPNQVAPPTAASPGASSAPASTSSSGSSSGSPIASAGSPGAGSSGAGQPIDSGSGPVSNSSGVAAPPLPNTNVE
jgi:hypothetical protein